jgi:uncharacterized integral membrane protein (TIGR00697 family)
MLSLSGANSRALRVFAFLLTVHTALLIASNAAGSKMIAVPGGLAASATVLSYMFSYVVLASIAELFGREFSKLVINVGLAAVAGSVLFFELAIFLPAASFWSNQQAYETVLGSTWRILAGGWSAYWIGQQIDVWGFFRIRETRWGAKFLWLRSWGSIALSQLIDTCIFMAVAFGGIFPLLPAIEGQFLIKIVIGTIATPLVYLLVGAGRRYMAGVPQ